MTPDEIERRRQKSVKEMERRDKEAWTARYQEMCDREYWKNGPCCAGCDHWQSDGGFLGECTASGIVSGMDVLKSMGVKFSSYIPGPGFPFTRQDHYCGMFRDEFDWSTLPEIYLHRIGAMRDGEIKEKPKHRRGSP